MKRLSKVCKSGNPNVGMWTLVKYYALLYVGRLFNNKLNFTQILAVMKN